MRHLVCMMMVVATVSWSLYGESAGTNAAANPARAEARVAVEPGLTQKLAQTIIPEIDFRQATVADVFEFFRRAAEEHSPFKDARNKGVNLVLQPELEKGGAVSAITFKARDMSLREALQAVASVAELEYETHETWILVKPAPRKKPAAPGGKTGP